MTVQKKERREMGEKGRLAEENFRAGYNCAQAVACAFADEMGIPAETAARMVCCFGGGMGRMREVCGCVSGMLFAAGALRGYNGPAENARKAEVYAMVQELAAQFRAETGSIICRELLGLSKPEGSPIPSPRTEEYYKKRPCPRLAALAGDILENYLAGQTPPADRPEE